MRMDELPMFHIEKEIFEVLLLRSVHVCKFCFCSFHPVYHGPSHVHKMNRLSELTEYEFRIYASNEAGDGPYSENCKFSTTKAPPPAVKREWNSIDLLVIVSVFLKVFKSSNLILEYFLTKFLSEILPFNYVVMVFHRSTKSEQRVIRFLHN